MIVIILITTLACFIVAIAAHAAHGVARIARTLLLALSASLIMLAAFYSGLTTPPPPNLDWAKAFAISLAALIVVAPSLASGIVAARMHIPVFMRILGLFVVSLIFGSVFPVLALLLVGYFSGDWL